MDDRRRFWIKVDKTASCWLWTAGVGVRGYGVFKLAGKSWSAHRLAYIWAIGPIPAGLQIDHLCGQKTCVRPDHMEPVTPQINTLRAPNAPAAINAAKRLCVRGHPLVGPLAKLYSSASNYTRRHCRACEHERYVIRRRQAGLPTKG